MSLLDKAKGLVDNNKTPGGDPGTQQQCQRLRFNSSDLKVRMDAVSSHKLTRQYCFVDYHFVFGLCYNLR